LPEAWFAQSLLPASELGIVGGALVGFLVLTFVNYGWHRLVHRVRLTWRLFHQVHHAAPRLDVSGAFLFHPSEVAAYTLISAVVTIGTLFRSQLSLRVENVAAASAGNQSAHRQATEHSTRRPHPLVLAVTSMGKVAGSAGLRSG
jgi:sterol desaturase/sphingolipid hydroxylase (fatty acid hydroxylase superfamily)